MPSRPVVSGLSTTAGAAPSTGRRQRGSTGWPPQSAIAGGIGGLAGEPPRRPVMLHFGDRDQSIPMEVIDKVNSAVIKDGYLAFQRALYKKERTPGAKA